MSRIHKPLPIYSIYTSETINNLRFLCLSEWRSSDIAGLDAESWLRYRSSKSHVIFPFLIPSSAEGSISDLLSLHLSSHDDTATSQHEPLKKSTASLNYYYT